MTFEYEEHQRLCLTELKVPDIEAILDIKDYSNAKRLFRADSVLDVREPPEPDNILWANLMLPTRKKVSDATSISSILKAHLLNVFIPLGCMVLYSAVLFCAALFCVVQVYNRVVSYLLTVAVFVVVWYIIANVALISPGVLGIVIGVLDSLVNEPRLPCPALFSSTKLSD